MLRRAWWAGLLLMSTVLSCVQTAPGELSKLAEGCVLNSDCSSPLVCAFRRCHNACATDRDCPAGLHCRNVDKPLNVCLLDDELRCPGGKDRECPGLMVCGPDLVCRDPCKSDRDCLDEQVCVQGVCAAPKETTNGELPRADDGGTLPCLYNSQCDAPLVCRGTCVRECLADRDCAQGANCVDGTCTGVLVPDAGLPPGFGANCSFNSDCLAGLRCGPTGTCTVECVVARDCDTGFSECCVEFACARGAACTVPPDGGLPDGGADAGLECINDLDCQDGVFCNGSERCLAGRCQPAVRAICDDGNPCSADSCSEALHTCSYMTIVPPDEDGDGHFPTACGGTADDCDDHAPAVYGGALERCDFIDNNCNGQVDEGLWQEDPLARGPLTTGDLYPGNAGAPRGLRVGGDVFLAAASDGTSRGSVDLWRVDPVTLAATHGPISLGASTTSWDTCYSGATFFSGRRSVLGALEAGPDGGLLASGVVGSYPTTMCCEAPVTPTATAFVTPVSGLSPGDGGVLVSTPISGNGCNGGFNLYARGVEVAAVAWIPSTQRYVVAWADNTRITGNVYQVVFSTFDPVTGALSMPRQVVQAGPTYNGSVLQYATSVEGGVVVAVGPPGVLVVWQDTGAGGGTRARFALFDDTLTQRLAGPSELALPVASPPANPVTATWDGEGFTVLLASASNTPAMLAGISPTGQVAWGPRALPASSIIGSNGGITAGSQPSFAQVGSGLMAAQARSAVFTMSWGPRGGDGGFQSLDFDPGTAATAHSDPELVVLDDRRVLLVWADGNLRKTLLRCQE